MVHAHVQNMGKRLVGLFLLSLAAMGLSFVSVVTSAQPAAAVDAPSAEAQFFARE